MKTIHCRPGPVALFALFPLVLLAMGCGRTVDPHAAWREVVTQVSTRPAYERGHEGAGLAVSNLLARGDHGWAVLSGGTDACIVHSGVVYRVAADGSISRPAPDATVAYAQVTWFAPDSIMDVMDLDPRLFQNMMRWKQPDIGRIKAMRITGHFKRLDLLAPSAVLRGEQEPVQTLERVNGLLLGFQMPVAAGTVVPSGFTLFYLSRDGATGGAVRDFSLGVGRIEIDDTPVLHVLLPELKP